VNAFVRRAPLLFVFASLPLLPLVASACKKAEQVAPEGAARRGARAGGGEGGVVFAVDLLPVEKKKLDYLVTAPGSIEAFERVQVTARVAGVVDRVAFREGQDVKKGDVLVTIDGERFRLTVNSAKAQLDKTAAALKDVEAQVARREGASAKNPGLIPGEELETFRTKVLTAKAHRPVAADAVKVAELNLRDSQVRAPLEGTIQTRTVETGQYVQTGYVMATLLKSDPLLLRFQVEPAEAVRLKPGMKVDFTMRETQRKFTAKVSLVSGAADLTTHMVGVTAQVDVSDNNTYWLRPGSFCDVALDVGASRDAPFIPRTAARPTDHGYVVYIAEGDIVREIPVSLGMNSKDGWVEVRAGLSGGELLVVRGAEALSTGARVRATQITSMDASAPRPEEREGGADPASAGSGARAARGGKRDGGPPGEARPKGESAP
jgi:RND family efflux transporter MFP subunit